MDEKFKNQWKKPANLLILIVKFYLNLSRNKNIRACKDKADFNEIYSKKV